MAPDIRPSSDLRNHYAEISRTCRNERRPTIITVQLCPKTSNIAGGETSLSQGDTLGFSCSD